MPHQIISEKTIRKAVIPAAGLGTRLRPLTKAYPKELLPIGRKPVLAHIAAEIIGAGITHALFIVSERKPQIEQYFGKVYKGDDGDQAGPPLYCEYVFQEEQRGLGDALLYAEEWTGNESFAVVFGDCMIDGAAPSEPLRRLIKTHVERESSASVLVETVPLEKVSRYGVLVPRHKLDNPVSEPFEAIDIVEKPDPVDAPSNQVVAARWILEPSIFPLLKAISLDSRRERNLTDAVRLLCQSGGKLWGVPLLDGEARRDIGNFETFYAAFISAAFNDPEFGESARKTAHEILNH